MLDAMLRVYGLSGGRVSKLPGSTPLTTARLAEIIESERERHEIIEAARRAAATG